MPDDRPAADLHERLGDRAGVLLQTGAAPAAEDRDGGVLRPGHAPADARTRPVRASRDPAPGACCRGDTARIAPMSVPAEIFKAYDIRGLYGDQIDGDLAEQIGRAFARVLGRPGGPAPRASSASASAATCACRPRSWPSATRPGSWPRASTSIDAGMVGTEMLYWLVGSRDLDGGLMCTASHNPKAYTGAKLVKRGAIALSGDAGIQDIRRDDRGRARQGAGRRHERARSRSTRSSRTPRSRSSTPRRSSR